MFIFGLAIKDVCLQKCNKHIKRSDPKINDDFKLETQSHIKTSPDQQFSTSISINFTVIYKDKIRTCFIATISLSYTKHTCTWGSVKAHTFNAQRYAKHLQLIKACLYATRLIPVTDAITARSLWVKSTNKQVSATGRCLITMGYMNSHSD